MNKEIEILLNEAASVRITDVDKAISLVKKAIELAENISDDLGYSQAMVQFAHYTMMLGNFEDAIDRSERARVGFDELNNESGVAEALYVKGNTYLKKGELHQGLQDLVSCLKIFENTNNLKGQAKASNSIGYVYKSFEDYKNALKHYQTNLEISKKFEDLNGQSNSYNHIAEIQLEQEEYTEGLATIDLAIPMKRTSGDKRGLGIGLHTKGLLLTKLQRREEALKTLSEALEVNVDVNDDYQMALCNMSIGALYIDQNKTEDALTSIERASSIAEKINAKEILYTCEHHFYIISELKKNFEKALGHFKRYHEIKEAVVSHEKNLKVKNIQLDYQIELAETMKSKNEELGLAHEELAEQHKSISDSITYAKRLQLALLPSLTELNDRINDNFIFFKPKDTVSGDFYWFEETNNVKYLAAADCTGHGVPGAMVSVVCSNALNRSVNEFGLEQPCAILDKTRELVIETFAKSGSGIRDGMDIAMCAIGEDQMDFAGAQNPFWIVRKTKYLTEEQKSARGSSLGDKYSLIEYKGSRQPIGLYERMTTFEHKKVQLLEGDTYYLFTDGFADQFGGPEGKKYKYRPFKNFLIELAECTLEEQKEHLQNEFESWKGDLEQIDDVCVIGFRL